MVLQRSLLAGFKISTCRTKEHNNRAIGKGKQGYYFRRNMKCLFQTIIVTIKSGFEWYINKKKITNNNENILWVKNQKPKNKVSYLKCLAKMKYKSLKSTENWKFSRLPDLAFYWEQIPSRSNPINSNYHCTKNHISQVLEYHGKVKKNK